MPIPKGVKHAGEYPIRRHVKHPAQRRCQNRLIQVDRLTLPSGASPTGNPERAMLTTVQQS